MYVYQAPTSVQLEKLTNRKGRLFHDPLQEDVWPTCGQLFPSPQRIVLEMGALFCDLRCPISILFWRTELSRLATEDALMAYLELSLESSNSKHQGTTSFSVPHRIISLVAAFIKLVIANLTEV
jgi:hypothetical protein